MPGPRTRGRRDHRLEEAIGALAAALNETRAPWTVIGGIAVISRGVKRMTTDVDAVVAGGEITSDRLLEVLAAHEVLPRIDDARGFAEAHLVLLMRHAPTGVDIDLSFGWTDLERRAIAMSEQLAFGRTHAPMARPADLVVFKAIAGRARDLEDTTSLLLLYPDMDVADIRRRIVELAALAEAPELVSGFDAVLASVRSDTKPPPPSGGPQRRRRR